jgi:hypothetical protein
VDGYVDIASRQSLSVEVKLVWDEREASLLVAARDRFTGEEVEIPVDRENAAAVYRDPFGFGHAPS